MSTQRKKYDMNSPESGPLSHEIMHGAFMKEGTMVAFATCFPGATIPIVADEGLITALDITPAGIVHGGTSGKKVHLFAGAFHGAKGVIFDLGTIDGAEECAAVCCGTSKLIAAVNGPKGGRVFRTSLNGMDSDMIQEWSFNRPTLEDLGEIATGEPILHAVAIGETVIGATTRHLFTVGIESGAPQIVGEVSGAGRLGVSGKGVYGLDDTTHLWRYDTADGQIQRRAIALPTGTWGAPLMWSRGARDGSLYTADDAGVLFRFSEKEGFSGPLGKAPLTPVGPMAVTFDGRVFGFCGTEMARMFGYIPAKKEVTDIGVALSVLERRRYGYTFADAITGRDGQIYFGENDNLGHLWIYFPSIQSI
jgi:hypothetical protein